MCVEVSQRYTYVDRCKSYQQGSQMNEQHHSVLIESKKSILAFVGMSQVVLECASASPGGEYYLGDTFKVDRYAYILPC